MSMADLERAIELIQVSGGGDFSGPRTEDQVVYAEQALGVEFPPTYRRFVRRLGSGGIFGEEFYGVVSGAFGNDGVPNAVWVTLNDRRLSNLPDSLVIIGATGDGGSYAIDLSEQYADGESPVVEWSYDSPPFKRIVADDFGVFFWQNVQEASASQ
jgi:antitoxin YobK